MSRQDKATTEKHTRTLRELVKLPDNKVCADCKRNDPRWASWNLGVFLCIRCSGIHRSMGTHISKVKSVDLDVWTPEQMQSIQKWGNRLANLYWEAHLKAGHIPPEHKMDSFIRSKYESRRWAMEGPVPSDPSTLDNGSSAPAPPSAPATPVQQTPPPRTHAQTNSFSSTSSATASRSNNSTRHQLLSAGMVNNNRPVGVTPASSTSSQTAPAPAPAAPAPPQNDLFSLDFHAPPSMHNSNNNSQQATQEQKKDVKQDILSLFSSPATQAAPSQGFGQFAGAGAWGAPNPMMQMQQQQQQPAVTSMMGQNGTGMWGASSGWGAGAGAGVTGMGGMPAQTNVWGTPAAPPQQVQQQQPNLFASGNDIWGGSSNSGVGMGGGMGGGASQDLFGSLSSSTLPQAQKKDDAFGDIWGGFK